MVDNLETSAGTVVRIDKARISLARTLIAEEVVDRDWVQLRMGLEDFAGKSFRDLASGVDTSLGRAYHR